MENIKYYPKSFVMSDELKAFFTVITNNEKLQQQLYETKKISEVAVIANQFGFNIRASEVVQAQAGRVLAISEEHPEDMKRLTSGLKPKTGAQWGRGGGNFLDRAGYWIIELPNPISTTDNAKRINRFIESVKQEPQLKEKLLNAKTFNDVASFCCANGLDITAVDLLSFQAQKILALSREEAEILANS